MSKRRNRRIAKVEAQPGKTAALTGGYGFGMNNGHQGADWTHERPYIYFPQLDTRKEIQSYTRTEILRRSRFFDANVGVATRILDGLPRMVAGTGLRPQAASGDRAWDKLAEKYAEQILGSAFSFDVGGRYDFGSSQSKMLRFAYRDGDASSILTESLAGNARFAFYEGHNIANAQITQAGFDQEEWNDGVRVDANNRPIAYRFPDPQDQTQYKDLTADRVIMLANYKRAGQCRGLSILAHAINNLTDITQIQSYIKQGIKLTNQKGYVITQQPGQANLPASMERGTEGMRITYSLNSSSDANAKLTFDQVTGGGAIPTLTPGKDLKVLSDERPHPNQLTFMEWLIRDIAWGAGLSPEIVWNIAALGGANTRFVLADAQGWIEEQQRWLVKTYCQRVWVYTIAKGIKSGALKKPAPGVEWWKCRWIPPPRLTVDFGKDGRIHLEMLKMGAITYSQILGWQSEDFETHMNSFLDQLSFIKSGLQTRGLNWDDFNSWRNINTQAAPDGASDGTAMTNTESANTDSEEEILNALKNNPRLAKSALTQLGAKISIQ